MTTKQYLMEVHRSRKKIESLKRREEELRTQAEGLRAIVYDKEKVQTSVVNRFDDLMAELVEVQRKYGKMIAICHKKIMVREDQIERMDNDRHEEILRYRYLEESPEGRQLTIRECAHKMMITYNTAKHLHGKALREFDRKYKVSTQ